MKKPGVLLLEQQNSSSLPVVGKKSGVIISHKKQKFIQLLTEAVEGANKDTVGKNKMKKLLDDDQARETFFRWAFEQNPDLMSMLYWFLYNVGYKGTKPLSILLELIKEASMFSKYKPGELTEEMVKKLAFRREDTSSEYQKWVWPPGNKK